MKKEKSNNKEIINSLDSSLVPLKQSFCNNPILQNKVEIHHISCDSSLQTSQLSLHDNPESSIEMFTSHLRCWAIQHHIAQTAVSDLLKILKSNLKLHSLASDARTILKTEDIRNKIINLYPGKKKILSLWFEIKIIIKINTK